MQHRYHQPFKVDWYLFETEVAYIRYVNSSLLNGKKETEAGCAGVIDIW